MKLDEEMQSLQLDRPVAGKSAQQLQKHTVDEQYNSRPIERSLYILTKGDDLQKLSIIQQLPQLLKSDNNATISRIIPKIQQELPNSSSEFHIVTSKIFKLLIEMDLPVNLLRPVLQGIESKDPIVSNAWIETLLAVIPSLSEKAIKTEVLPSAVSISHLNKPVCYRVASCKMLGSISTHPKLTSFDVKKDILPLAQSLCQDCFYEVRAAMCAELPKVAQGLGSDNLVKSNLLPGLVELSSDENSTVRAAAVDAVVFMIPYLNQDTIKQTSIPLVKQLCAKSSKEGDCTFPVIARVFGLLLNNLQQHLSNADSAWFINFFKQLSKRGLIVSPEELDFDAGLGVTCRQCCAYNLPAVTYFTVNKIPSEIDNWYLIFKNLAGDPCYLVRKTVAGCIYEIARILGNQNQYILPDVVKLLRDDAEEVLDSLVPNIGSTLELFCTSGLLSRETTTQSTLEIGRALLKCQVELFKCYNWRRKLAFLEQLEHLPNCMASDFIHQHFTPVVLKLTVEARSRPVRTQATRTMLIFLRYNVKENHRKWIRESLINVLCNAHSCYTRHIYINMCINALEIYSFKYFKQHFFLPLLTLAEDPVSTVRLCVVKLCPILKHMLVLPIDRNLQIKLENAFSKMEAMETDKDVVAMLKTKLKEMRAPQVNKQEALIEEKRRTEEEEKIQQGKLSHPAKPVLQPTMKKQSRESSLQRTPAITLSRSNLNRKPRTPVTTSDMSFLGQHFYIDAGVALPEKIDTSNTLEGNISIEENINSLKLSKNETNGKHVESLCEDLKISTVSVENTNVENMSDEDLKELETSTTNITDDVKVNIQKMSLSKATTKNKAVTDTVKKRNKRYSCVFPLNQEQSNTTVLKRRSLNMASSELSKIPVCFKTTKKSEENATIKRSKSGSIQSIYSSSSKKNVSESKNEISSKVKPTLKMDIPSLDNKSKTVDKFSDSVKTNTSNNNNRNRCNLENTNKREVKENVPISTTNIKTNVLTKCTKDNNAAKVSNLPVLIRRTQSEVRK